MKALKIKDKIVFGIVLISLSVFVIALFNTLYYGILEGGEEWVLNPKSVPLSQHDLYYNQRCYFTFVFCLLFTPVELMWGIVSFPTLVNWLNIPYFVCLFLYTKQKHKWLQLTLILLSIMVLIAFYNCHYRFIGRDIEYHYYVGPKGLGYYLWLLSFIVLFLGMIIKMVPWSTRIKKLMTSRKVLISGLAVLGIGLCIGILWYQKNCIMKFYIPEIGLNIKMVKVPLCHVNMYFSKDDHFGADYIQCGVITEKPLMDVYYVPPHTICVLAASEIGKDKFEIIQYRKVSSPVLKGYDKDSLPVWSFFGHIYTDSTFLKKPSYHIAIGDNFAGIKVKDSKGAMIYDSRKTKGLME